MYIVGTVQQIVGRVIGNQRQQTKGFQRKIAGKAIIALGDAQKLLKSCIKQHRSI
jgi:uncharacterized protein YjbJ (UPF0337 family)